MKIWHLSDTHCFHDQIVAPEEYDLIVHSGDFAGHKSPELNEPECHKFLEWFGQLQGTKILIAGNHDSAVEARMVTKAQIEDIGDCTYLEHESVTVSGIKFFGSPYTPVFNNWAFNRKPNALHRLWQVIDDDTDVLITHGPAYGEFDLCEKLYSPEKLKHAGCKNLLNRMREIPSIKAHLFGHIHNDSGDLIINNVVGQINGLDWISSNACSVNDGREYGKVVRSGNIVTLDI